MLTARDYLTKDRRARRVLRAIGERDPERLEPQPDKPDPLPAGAPPNVPAPVHPARGDEAEGG